MKQANSWSLPIHIFMLHCPGLTFAGDWALNNNYLSTYLELILGFQMKTIKTLCPAVGCRSPSHFADFLGSGTPTYTPLHHLFDKYPWSAGFSSDMINSAGTKKNRCFKVCDVQTYFILVYHQKCSSKLETLCTHVQSYKLTISQTVQLPSMP